MFSQYHSRKLNENVDIDVVCFSSKRITEHRSPQCHHDTKVTLGL